MPDGASVGLPQRLKAATERLIGRDVHAGDRFGIAVSGGADSMALLHAAAALWPGQVAAATVDHGLRAEAADEAEMVGCSCNRAGVPHMTLRPAKPITGSVQAQARTARYRLLEDWRVEQGLDWLLTAHQADDQIETVLMRLSRGSGPAGLSAIRGRRDVILRPLLGERRSTLRNWCIARNIRFIDDPSNVDDRFDRARLRGLIGGLDLIDPAGLQRSVDALADADAALDWMESALFADHVRQGGQGELVLDRTDMPAAILRRLLVRMINEINPDAENPRGPSMDQALVQLFDGKAIALADCILTGGPEWTVRRAPARRSV